MPPISDHYVLRKLSLSITRKFNCMKNKRQSLARHTAAKAVFFRLTPIALLAAASFGAQAQQKPDGLWHGGISIGGSAASGNTDSTALAVTADGTRATAADKISLYGLLNYASNKQAGVTNRTSELFRIGGRYDYNLSQTMFVFGGGEAETNKAGGVDSRYNINTGAGYHLINNDRTIFDVFGGIGYASTDFTNGSTREGAQLLIGEESTHRVGEATTFKQKLVFYPGQSDIGNRATFDATLATAITGGWTLNTGIAVRYDSKVAAGLKNTDTLLTAGFGYKY